MANQIIPKKSVIPNRVPTAADLVFGEVSINHADKIIYARHPSGGVQQIAASPQHTHTLADISDLGDLEYVVENVTSPSETYNLKVTDSGDITVSNAAGTLTTTLEINSTLSRVITLPDKAGTVALLDDISGGGGGELISQDGTKKIALNNDGSLDYDLGTSSNLAFTLPGGSGTLGLRGGDTVISQLPPASPYIGLRWVDLDLMRSFDWIIDPSTGLGAWVETGVGADGRLAELRRDGGYIQWRYVGDTSWVNLLPLQDIKGDSGVDGDSVELRLTSTHIQWRPTRDFQWYDLVDLNQIKGAAGSDAAVTSANISAALGYLPDSPTSARPPTDHYHMVNGVDRYYTRSEANTLLAAKQASGSYSVVGHGHAASEITGVLSVDQIPVIPTQVPVVASGGLDSLTVSQQAEILQGTVVITSQERYVYKGSGLKTTVTNYIVLADITPDWSVITNKPLTFTAAAHEHPATQVTGLSDVARSGLYSDLVGAPTIPADQVSSDWAATTGVAAILNKPNLSAVATSGDYNHLINKPAATQRVSRSSWVSPHHYYGYAPSGTAENQVGWTIRRITTTSAGGVSSSLSASGAWSNRANLNYL